MTALLGRPVRRRTVVLASLAVAAAIPLTSCGLTDVSMSSSSTPEPSTNATLAFTPTLGDNAVAPGSPITVTAHDGRITSVKVVSADGKALPGKLSTDAQKWVSSRHSLGYGSQYLVEVTAVNRDGMATSTRQAFRTLVPQTVVGVSGVDPSPDTTFGVGMPITLTFNESIANKAAVEKHLQVVTPTPIVGAWRWLSDTQVEYRPKKYWPGDIPIKVNANLTGVQVSPGVWGDKDRTFRFRTSDSIVGRVDMNKHTLTVVRNGKVIRVIPVTTGKPGFDTRSGTKLVMTKERYRLMDAASGGTAVTDPNYYKIMVEYAMRLTWSGEFLHAAPWSEGSQGSDNVSHGCTGMSTENAQWLYSISNIGDVYEYVGNNYIQTDDGNGITVWNNTWQQWLKGSEAGPHTSTTPAST